MDKIPDATKGMVPNAAVRKDLYLSKTDFKVWYKTQADLN